MDPDFGQLAARGYRRVPVPAEVRADLFAPRAVYLRLAGGRRASIRWLTSAGSSSTCTWRR